MIGRIRCFIPGSRRGLLQTDAGDELPFLASETCVNLQAGDVVQFELVGGSRSVASDLVIRQRWVDRLSESYRPLVNEFYQLMRSSCPERENR